MVVGTTDNDGSLPNFWTLDSYNYFTEDVIITNYESNADRLTCFCDVRPYLFPLSSMTEEQKEELRIRFCYEWGGDINDLHWQEICIEDAEFLIDFFNENHLDYRSLISMGLAIDATGLDIY